VIWLYINNIADVTAFFWIDGGETIYDAKIKSKNNTQKSLNNICTPDTFTFIKKQDIMTDYFKRVA